MTDATIADALQALGRAPNDVLTPPLARDVCTHARGSVLVDGDISLAADTYTLVVEATRCADGAHDRARGRDVQKEGRGAAGARARDRATARGAGRVARVAAGVRRAAAGRDDRLTRGVARIPSRAWICGLRADNIRAIPALKTAISLDPQFALAYAQLGSAYSNIGAEVRRVAVSRSKAFDLRDRVTEPERLFITGRYFDIITREMEKAIENYRLWTRPVSRGMAAVQRAGERLRTWSATTISPCPRPRARWRSAARQLFPRVNLMTALCSTEPLYGVRGRGQAKSWRGRPTTRRRISCCTRIARHAGDAAAAERESAWARAAPVGFRPAGTWRPRTRACTGASRK